MELSRYVENLLILEVRQNKQWKLISQPKKDKIKDIGVKEKIKENYPGTNIKKWKKEYSKYINIRDNSFVEIHRFVNCGNFTQEYGVKIKKYKINTEVKKLIAVALDSVE